MRDVTLKKLKLYLLYIMVDKEIETYIVMAKHDSLWITSGPRLCISREVEVEGESEVEKEKKSEGRRVRREGKMEEENRGKGRWEERKRDHRIKREGKEREKDVSISSAGASCSNSQCR